MRNKVTDIQTPEVHVCVSVCLWVRLLPFLLADTQDLNCFLSGPFLAGHGWSELNAWFKSSMCDIHTFFILPHSLVGLEANEMTVFPAGTIQVFQEKMIKTACFSLILCFSIFLAFYILAL